MKSSGKYRWKILSLLFMATVINYLDRGIIGVLGPTLGNHVFFWTDQEYATIQIAFKVAYAVGLIAMGTLIDKFGTRIGYTVSIVTWSIFGMSHALVTKSMGWIGFMLARVGLGFGEAGNFPAAIKTVAEWFPRKERAYATGLFNAGSNVGAILAPISVALLVTNDGQNWQYPFLITGVLSSLWVVLWLRTYRKPAQHPRVSAEELLHIQSDGEVSRDERKISWGKLLGVKQTWGFMLAKTTDAVWLFYLFWGGFFLNRTFGLELKGLALPLIVIYLVADLGSIGGGWLSSRLIKMNWPVYKARKVTLLICVVFILPVIAAPQVHSAWPAILLIAMAAAGHQAWSANLFTIASDVFPKKATASIVGLGGMVGYATAGLADYGLGKVLTDSGSVGYVYAFSIAAGVYVAALLMIHFLLGKMEPLDDDLKRKS